MGFKHQLWVLAMSKFWELGKFRNRWSPVIVMIVVEWDVKLGFAEGAKKSRLSSTPSWNIHRVLNGEYLQALISHTLPETSKSHLKNRPSAKEMMLFSCHSFSRGKLLVLEKFKDCSCELLVYQSWSCWRHNIFDFLPILGHPFSNVPHVTQNKIVYSKVTCYFRPK